MHRPTLSELVIIDPSVEQHHTLLKGLKPQTAAIALNSIQDGVVQVTDILQWHQSITRIHIVSQASPGELKLGSIQLNLQTLRYYTELLRTWFPRRLQHRSSISFYACNLAAGDAGTEFLTTVHRLTGATLHASSRPVGNRELGGHWTLDVSMPTPAPHHLSPFSTAVLQNFSGVLSSTPSCAR